MENERESETGRQAETGAPRENTMADERAVRGGGDAPVGGVASFEPDGAAKRSAACESLEEIEDGWLVNVGSGGTRVWCLGVLVWAAVGMVWVSLMVVIGILLSLIT